jgi:hypothetical protein
MPNFSADFLLTSNLHLISLDMTNDEAGTSERRQGSEEENEADLAA